MFFRIAIFIGLGSVVATIIYLTPIPGKFFFLLTTDNQQSCINTLRNSISLMTSGSGQNFSHFSMVNNIIWCSWNYLTTISHIRKFCASNFYICNNVSEKRWKWCLKCIAALWLSTKTSITPTLYSFYLYVYTPFFALPIHTYM